MEPTTTTTTPTTTWTNNISNTPLNPYDVLKLRKDATPSEIVLSYRKLALFHHPGRKRSEITSCCPIELRRKMDFFEVLAACYETLMHNEFRRRYDILLKDIEKKQKQQPQQNNNNNNNNNSLIPPRSNIKNATTHGHNYNNNGLVVKVADSIPGLIPSASSSDKAGSDDTSIPTENNCSSMMLLCGGSSSPFADSNYKNKKNITNASTNFTMSRDGTKGFKSLMDSHRNTSSVSHSHSSSQGGSGEEDGGKREAEVHFSEDTVNRLFGGPLASLHRARNFQTFTDPYLVFNKVFGCTNANDPIIFPRVKATDINHHNHNHHNDGTCTSTENNKNNELIPLNENKIENDGSYSNGILTRSASMSSQWTHSRLDSSNNNGSTKDQQTATSTKVFVSSRIIHGRKITKTETVHVDPETGMASVNVTVDGEYIDNTTTTNNKKSKKNNKNKKSSSSSQYHHTGVGGDASDGGDGGVGAVVSDWLLCFGTSTSKVCPSSTKNTCNNPCRRIKSVYVEVLEEFYLCNNNFYEECNRYMSCGG
ncbi:MAG: curved DNA-binding protein CbpA [Bacillariaceae sp.]|jgi:curved DNA-binding protein CbpA